MAKPIGLYGKTLPENVAKIVKDVLKAAEYAEGVKVSISIKKIAHRPSLIRLTTFRWSYLKMEETTNGR